jgi:hypothetical protein
MPLSLVNKVRLYDNPSPSVRTLGSPTLCKLYHALHLILQDWRVLRYKVPQLILSKDISHLVFDKFQYSRIRLHYIYCILS